MSEYLKKIKVTNWPHFIVLVGLSIDMAIFQEQPVFTFTENRLKLEHAQTIKQQLVVPPSQKPSILLVETNDINLSAQNALLKVSEEPADGWKLLIKMPSLEGVLPTILSRAEVVYLSKSKQATTLNPKQYSLLPWVNMTYAERWQEVIAWIKEIDKEENQNRWRDVLMNMIIELESNLPDSYQNKDWLDFVVRLLKLKDWLHNSGSSPKYILEWLALSMPAT